MRRLFHVRLVVQELASDRYNASISSANGEDVVPVWLDSTHIRFQPSRIPIAFDGILSEDKSRIEGFVEQASHVTRVSLRLRPGSEPHSWEAEWTPLGIPDDSVRLDLYVGDDGDGGIGGYWFFRDQRLPALWGYGLSCGGDAFVLGEKNLDLHVAGRLERQRDVLTTTVTGAAGSARVTFRRMPQALVPNPPDAPEEPPRPAGADAYVEHAPEPLDDGWPTARPSTVGIDADGISRMVASIAAGELPLTHGVLIARHGSLAVEEYFYGFDRETLHDMRSASKTITSSLIGLAIQGGRIARVESPALSFFPEYRRYANWDPRKARITIRDLLTMSSGLDANDADRGSVAGEGTYQSQTDQPDWIKLALDAPMIADPGAQPLYGGANPLILGGILAHVVDEPVEWFADRELFGPLGIERYSFFLDPTGVVYMGGGMYMRPRDMLKYGQLYLDGGVWRGRRVLSEAWVRESWGRYGRLAPLDRNGHDYGYLWWHHHYDVDGRTIETVEARGNGGQYIFVVPSLDMVIVITAGNFRTGRTRQPEEIVRRYVLPAIRPDDGRGAEKGADG